MFSRRAQRPRSTFVRKIAMLTALSFVHDFVAEASGGSRPVLILTHVIAAAIIIPTLAARLPRKPTTPPPHHTATPLDAYDQAIERTTNPAEREFLIRQRSLAVQPE